MPELPDIVVYVESLRRMLVGKSIENIQLRSPFLVRTFEPDLMDCCGKTIKRIDHIAKRIYWQLEDDTCLLFHLMIAGRFHWRKVGTKPRSKNDLLAIQFAFGCLMLTEASGKKRASLFVLNSADELAAHDRGGLDVVAASLAEFKERLTQENHTVKRALADPRLFSGIGNAYSDEILHAAKLSPVTWTSRLDDEQIERLHRASVEVLQHWIESLRAESLDKFPEKVTAFRKDMAVHGKFGVPCPICSTQVQRIVYANNECNYCPTCQNGGRILADRSLSRLLKSDWPRTVQQWEEHFGG